MRDVDLKVGDWYGCDGQLLRYEGKNSEGAHIFSKFKDQKVVGTVEIFNVDPIEPWPTSQESPKPR